MVLVRLGAQVQSTGDDAVVEQTLLDGLLHLLPHLFEIEPQAAVLALLHILPERETFLLDILHDFLHGVVRVDLTLGRDAQRHLALFGGEIASADAVHQPRVHHPTLGVEGFEEHAVGMERLDDVGPPYDFHLLGCQAASDGHVGVVALARGGQRAVEGNAIAGGLLGAGGEHLGRTVGSHGVAAAGTVAYLVYLLDGFHNYHYNAKALQLLFNKSIPPNQGPFQRYFPLLFFCCSFTVLLEK